MTKADNKLKHFQSEDELFDTTDNDVILKWVNELWTLKEKTRSWGQRHRLKRKLFEEVAKQLLDGDEIERVNAEVEERMEGKEAKA